MPKRPEFGNGAGLEKQGVRKIDVFILVDTAGVAMTGATGMKALELVGRVDVVKGGHVEVTGFIGEEKEKVGRSLVKVDLTPIEWSLSELFLPPDFSS